MTRTFRHQPFRADDHVARLYRSLKYSGIAVPLTQEEMLAKTRELAAANCKLFAVTVTPMKFPALCFALLPAVREASIITP